MVWNEESILRLRELWDQGLSTAEIGRRLGVSKNAIVGKAHRLDLTARPSPIRREPSVRVERPATPPRVGGPTLPPLASAVVTPAVVATVQPLRPAPVAAPAPRPVVPPPHVAPPVRTLATPSAPRRTPACCWPIGEPGKKDFRFCDDASVPGKPYCDEHAKLAYVKIRDRKEDAA
ncbi:MAG: GcrA cell cycle regulator [Proteobacteria bacterium]|nr:GcrA cell cycle regulator [Pseudomonadota bacterium]